MDVHIGEKGSSEIVRGIAARFKDFGVEISGFDMYTTSNVLGGSGISSSAAFVPNDLVNAYRSEMDRIFGQNSCYIMTIRPFGGIEIK